MVTKVRGRSAAFEGTLAMDEENPQASFVEGTVDVASLKTAISLRDANLRSAGFFDARRFPKMGFRSTRIESFEGNNFKVYGELTIKSVTREVVFDVVNKGEMPATQGKRRWAFGASIALNRKDFGLKWNPLIELGGLLVGDEVDGTIEMQLVQE
jgi:polyisoprenoid-binding protein YceI